MSEHDRCMDAVQLAAWSMLPDSVDRLRFGTAVSDVLVDVEFKAHEPGTRIFAAFRHAVACAAHSSQSRDRPDADALLYLLELLDEAKSKSLTDMTVF